MKTPGDIAKMLSVALALSAAAGFAIAAKPHGTTTQSATMRSVPEPYVGSWVCQTVTPGYNLLLPNSDPSQPLTNKATTPSTWRNVIRDEEGASISYWTCRHVQARDA